MARAKTWTNIIQSILVAIQNYWSALFVLPKATITLIERTLRAFLWKGSDLKMGGAKVAWTDICCPKINGGIGIPNLMLWNQGCNLKNLWHLLTDSADSIWLDWV